MSLISFTSTAVESPTPTVTTTAQAYATKTKGKPSSKLRSRRRRKTSTARWEPNPRAEVAGDANPLGPVDQSKPLAELPPDFLPPDGSEPADGGWGSDPQPAAEPETSVAAAADVDATDDVATASSSAPAAQFCVSVFDPKTESATNDIVFRGSAGACVRWAQEWLTDPVGLTVAITPPGRNDADESGEVAIDSFGTESQACAVLGFDDDSNSIDYRLRLVSPANCLRDAVEIAIQTMIANGQPHSRNVVPVLAVGDDAMPTFDQAEQIANLIWAAYRVGLERGQARDRAAKGGVA